MPYPLIMQKVPTDTAERQDSRRGILKSSVTIGADSRMKSMPPTDSIFLAWNDCRNRNRGKTCLNRQHACSTKMKRTSKVTTAKEFNHKTYELDPDASDQGIELEARPMPHSWDGFSPWFLRPKICRAVTSIGWWWVWSHRGRLRGYRPVTGGGVRIWRHTVFLTV